LTNTDLFVIIVSDQGGKEPPRESAVASDWYAAPDRDSRRTPVTGEGIGTLPKNFFYFFQKTIDFFARVCYNKDNERGVTPQKEELT